MFIVVLLDVGLAFFNCLKTVFSLVFGMTSMSLDVILSNGHELLDEDKSRGVMISFLDGWPGANINTPPHAHPHTQTRNQN